MELSIFYLARLLYYLKILTIMSVFVAYDLLFLLNEIIITVPSSMLVSLIPCFVPPLKLTIFFHFQLSVKSPQTSTDVAEQGAVLSQEILSNVILFCFFFLLRFCVSLTYDHITVVICSIGYDSLKYI